MTLGITPQVAQLLRALVEDMRRDMLQERHGLRGRKSFRENHLQRVLADGLVEMTIPDKPNSRRQKYRLTEKGWLWLRENTLR